MGVYPRRTKSYHETFSSDTQINRPSLDIKVVIEPGSASFIVGLYLGHDENETKALYTV